MKGKYLISYLVNHASYVTYGSTLVDLDINLDEYNDLIYGQISKAAELPKNGVILSISKLF